MAAIQPFRAIHFHRNLVDLSKVVAPPYDVISKQLQEELYRRSPDNVIRLDLNPEPDPYSAAAAEMRRMLKEGILVRDDRPGIYPCFQTFRTQDGAKVTRRGFVSWLKLEPFEAGVVLPHERTLSKPKEDRLKLMIATRATFSQVFGLYGDQDRTLEKKYDELNGEKPFLEAEYDGVTNRIYAITDSATMKTFQDLMRDLPVYIADGHHRYETALEYQRLMHARAPGKKGQAWDYLMMYFTNMFDSGLVVFPTHRIVHSLKSFTPEGILDSIKPHFELTAQSDVDALSVSLTAAGEFSFGLVLQSKKYFLMKLKKETDLFSLLGNSVPTPVKKLDVTLLHDFVLGQKLGISKEAQEKKLNIDYTIDRREVDNAVQSCKAQLGFILNSTKVQQVREVADAGAVMPQKSTYFYPKLLSGMLLSKLE